MCACDTLIEPNLWQELNIQNSKIKFSPCGPYLYTCRFVQPAAITLIAKCLPGAWLTTLEHHLTVNRRVTIIDANFIVFKYTVAAAKNLILA